MVHEVLPPRVEDGNEAGLNTETFLREFRECLGGYLEQNGVENFPVSLGKGIELVR
jgi:hypothetical protein